MARVTIRDIAAHAGTSFKTVSRVINKESGVGDAMRDKVRASMLELGYRPVRAAQTLRGGRNYAICVLSALSLDRRLDFEGAPDFVSGLMAGALKTCRDEGFQLVFETVAFDENNADSIKQRLLDLRCDGVILFPPHADQISLLDNLDALQIKYVRIAPGIEADRSQCIVVDDFAAGYEMGEIIANLGHRDIACIAGPDSHIAARRRADGFRSALAGRKDISLTMAEGDFSFDSGLQHARTLLEADLPPSAIFATNDLMAIGTMAAARDLGLRLPEDLSIACFDDTPMTRFVRPSMTAISQNVLHMGALAANMLVGAINSGDSMDTHARVMGYEIKLRESLAYRTGTG